MLYFTGANLLLDEYRFVSETKYQYLLSDVMVVPPESAFLNTFHQNMKFKLMITVVQTERLYVSLYLILMCVL